MTTQVPHDVAAPPPEPQYPTAPPWATSQPAGTQPAGTHLPGAQPAGTHLPGAQPAGTQSAAPAYGGITPNGAPLPQYGQLLVPFPEEMQRAGRAKPPALWPIAPLTLLFVVAGLISTVRRAGQAQRAHRSGAPYWIVFVTSLAASVVLWGIVVAVAKPVLQSVRETAITKTVQENLVKDGKLTTAWNITATGAQCEAVGSRVDDQRRYDCVLTLDDGRTGSLSVTADSEGKWTTVTAAAPVKKK